MVFMWNYKKISLANNAPDGMGDLWVWMIGRGALL
jgi:hypothetical protein